MSVCEMLRTRKDTYLRAKKTKKSLKKKIETGEPSVGPDPVLTSTVDSKQLRQKKGGSDKGKRRVGLRVC
jgi:hypothetical protein